MPSIEVLVGDDGKIEKVPAEIQKLIDRAFGQGQAKAADEAAEKTKAEIERLKKAGDISPAERERLRTLEVDLSKAREDLALRDKNYEEAQKIRDARHAADLADRDGKVKATEAELEKRTGRIRDLLGKEIRAIATAEGARKESLDELEVLLGGRIGLDDALQAVVKDAKDAGKTALDKDGQPVTVEGLVKQYLTDHPHHRAGTPGRGGGAGGGRSTVGATGATGEKAHAFDALERNPSVASVAAAFAHVGKGAT